MKKNEQGFALLEALIASAMAAAVIAAAATSLSFSLRSSAKMDDQFEKKLAARNIEAQLRAAITPAEISEQFPDWEIKRADSDTYQDVQEWIIKSPSGDISHSIWILLDE